MRSLSTMQELVQEEQLYDNVLLVASNQKLADKMYPRTLKWFDRSKNRDDSLQQVCSASLVAMNYSQIMQIHRLSGHSRVRCTTYFVR